MSPHVAQRDSAMLDPHVWKAFAGASGKVPAVGSLVYYFPQGHAEQAFSTPDFSSVSTVRPYFLCRVTAVRLLASGETDEVFARIDLDPGAGTSSVSSSEGSPESTVEEPEEGVAGGGSAAMRWFPKMLTPSDANNGGGFSVPRFCAENVFPRLDTAVGDPPVQILAMRDVHGVTWQFKHIFRGTPRRHLLTTGWSKFVNCKKLVAGDSVVFARSREGELFVGVRRSLRATGSDAPTTLKHTSPTTCTEIKMEESSFPMEGYSRSVRGMIPAKSVVESVKRAQLGVPFEVVYYPSVGSPEFLVPAAAVDDAMFEHWAVGVRVRMGLESEDLLRTTWFQGTISGISFSEQGLWSHSPWRALQITWDEPDALTDVKSVNPWQVESLSPLSHLQIPTYPATKKTRLAQASELLVDGENNLLFPLTVINNTAANGNLTPPFVGPTYSPTSMQGARHECFSVSSFLNLETPGWYPKRNFINVSTELNLGGNYFQSLLSQKDFDPGLLKGTMNATSLRLFGQTIMLERDVGADDKAFSRKRRQTLQHEVHVFRA